MRRVAMLALVTASWGCGPSFDPASLVTAPRLVAVVAEPPELAYEGSSALTAVVTDPEAVAEASFGACPLSAGSTGGYACLAPEVALPSDGLAAALDAAPFGAFVDALADDFARYAPMLEKGPLADDPCLGEVLSTWQACGTGDACDAAAGQGAAACLRDGGIDVTVRVHLRFDGGEAFDTYKRVRLRVPTDDHPLNRNPRLTGVRVALVDATGEGVTLVAGGSTAIPAGAAVRLLPVLAEGSVEEWRHDGVDHRELVSFSWFTTAGSFDHGRSTADVPDVELALPEAGSDEAVPQIDLWLVTRDDRYGADALGFALEVGPADGGAP